MDTSGIKNVIPLLYSHLLKSERPSLVTPKSYIPSINTNKFMKLSALKIYNQTQIK